MTGELEGVWSAELSAAERLWRLFVLALYRAERQADALAVYRRAREMPAAELGLDQGGAASAGAGVLRRTCRHRPPGAA